MKRRIGIVTRCVAFFLICSLLLSHTTGYVIRDDDESNEIHAFYSEPRDSLDVIWIGSSPLLRGVSPMVMYEKHGFTGYVRASALQAPSVSYGLLAEALERQTPELVVLICDNIFLEYDYAKQEGDMRRAMDGMKNSIHKFRIIAEVVAADERQSILSYIFPVFRYHDRWKEFEPGVTEAVKLMEHSFKKGHVYLRGGEARAYPENFMEPSGVVAPAFNESARNYYEKAIRLCQDKGIEVLIIHLPKMSWTYEQSRAIEDFAEEMDVIYLDLDQEVYRSQLGINPETDYYDQGHMNLRGSLKLSDWLGDYLKENYELVNHRGDFTYQIWEEDLARYKERTNVQ